MALVALLLGLYYYAAVAEGFVIAPPWANPVINPCSKKSWQLIFWPPDGQCYQIFEQGPCPDTQELAFHATNKQVSKYKFVLDYLASVTAILRCLANLILQI